MDKIFICSRFEGDSEKHKQLARIYCLMVWNKGYLPIAPHLYFPQFLDNNNKEQREAIMQVGLNALRQCKAVYVYGRSVSDGMRREIKLAEELKIPITYFDEYGDEV